YLESQLAAPQPGALEHTAAQLIGWKRVTTFGPASSVRSILEAGAAPLVSALGFEAPSQVDAVGAGLAATVHRDRRPVALLVAPWRSRLDAFWRPAVTEALRRGAVWCLVFDGSRLRVFDASRLYARRYVEFDLDVALDHAAGIAALCRSAS